MISNKGGRKEEGEKTVTWEPFWIYMVKKKNPSKRKKRYSGRKKSHTRMKEDMLTKGGREKEN